MSISKTTCKARQYSDEMQCGWCGLCWDVNDPDPPECRVKTVTGDVSVGRRNLEQLRDILRHD